MIAEGITYRPSLIHEGQPDNLPATGGIEAYLVNKDTSMGLDSVRLCAEDFGKKRVYYLNRVSIRTNSVVIYRENCERGSAPPPKPESLANLTRGDYNGYLSPNTARKCKRMLEGWINSMNCAASSRLRDKISGHIYTTFVTLTLQSKQVHTDNEIKRQILGPFIKRIVNDLGVKQYFWKAEPQENGNIHFHMLIDAYLDREILSNYWDASCEYLGYVSRYFETSGTLFAPATNIVGLPRDNSAIKYVIKYLAKAPIKARVTRIIDGKPTRVNVYFQEKVNKGGGISYCKYRPIQGRVWGCSDMLREVKPFTASDTERTDCLLASIEDSQRFRFMQRDRVQIWGGPVLAHLRSFDTILWKAWRWHHLALFRYLYLDREKPPSGDYAELRDAFIECRI